MALVQAVPQTKDTSLFHLCEFIEDCEFTELSTQVRVYVCAGRQDR